MDIHMDRYINCITLINGKFVFKDGMGRIHKISPRRDKKGFAYIVYMNKHVYFRTFSQDGGYSFVPYVRNGDEVVNSNSGTRFKLNSLCSGGFLTL